MKPPARWDDDCTGKKDYDGNILAISSRYWPAGGGFYVSDGDGFRLNEDNNVKPCSVAHLLFYHREGDINLVESPKFEGASFAEVKVQVEAWVQQNYDNAYAALRAAFDPAYEQRAAGFDLADDTFTRKQRVHDWRNHVTAELQQMWAELTRRERLLLALNAQAYADAENWD